MIPALVLQPPSPSRRTQTLAYTPAGPRGLTDRAPVGVQLRTATVSAEGDLDFRGTLGVAKDAPVGFAQIRLQFDVSTDASQEKLDQLLKLTERYCVVYQTIKSGPPVEVTLKRS